MKVLIEGFYSIDVSRKTIQDYFQHLTKNLKLRMYGKPVIFSPGGIGKKENQGYDAFVPLIDPGISAYVWSSSKFVSIVIYTCKSFDERIAMKTTKDFFKIKKTEKMSF